MQTLRMGAAVLGTAGALALATAAAAQAQTYRVDANGERDITLKLCGSQVRVEVRGDGDTDLDFLITNPAGKAVHSDVDNTDWTVATIENSSGGCHDYTLHVENYGRVYNEFTVRLTEIGRAAGDGRNRRVSVHNHTGETIYYVYWSNTGDDSWREDRLGSDVLLDDEEWDVEVDDGSGACRFDFKVRTASSREVVRNNINVCETTIIDFN